jgi:hypothetical protein
MKAMRRALIIHLAVLGLWWLAQAGLYAQEYKADKAGPPPRELAPVIAQALAPAGFRITHTSTPYCELWLRAELPAASAPEQDKVTLPGIAPGTLVGVIRFDGPAMDRRGQAIRPGVYILRYGIMPLNIAHEGAAPERDFLLLTPAAEDRDLKTLASSEALVALSRKVSGVAHPAVLAVRKAETDSAGFSERDGDWVLEARAGDTAIALVVAGASGN